MKQLSTAAALSFFLAFTAACGGSEGSGAKVDSKNGAAGAAYDLQQQGESLNARSGRGLSPAQVGGIPGTGGVSTEHTVTVEGKTGRAIMNYKTDVTSGEVSVEYTIKYENFSETELQVLDGEVTHRVLVNEGLVETQMTGAVDISGETEASIEMDVYVKVTNGSVELRGNVTADGVSYDFNGEVLDLDAID